MITTARTVPRYLVFAFLASAVAGFGAGDFELKITPELRCKNFIGFGWNENGARSPKHPGAIEQSSGKGALTAEDYRKFFDLLAWSGADLMRVGYFVENENIQEGSVYEPENDNNDPEVLDEAQLRFANPIHERYKLYLRNLKERGSTVLLSSWAQPAPWNSHCFPEREWEEHPPKDAAEYAESITALVKQLLLRDGFDNIRYVSLWNEPDGDWAFRDVDGANHYPQQWWPYVGQFHQRAMKEGIRERFKLVPSEATKDPGTTVKQLAAYGSMIDGATQHDYKSKSPILPKEHWVNYQPLVTALGDKPLIISEYGNAGEGPLQVKGDEAIYNGCVSIAGVVTDWLNQGVGGFCRWAWTGGNETHGQPNSFSPLRFNDVGYYWRIHEPVYYSHAIQARYIKPGWRTHVVVQSGGGGTGGTRVRGAAASSLAGEISIFLVNDDAADANVCVRFDEGAPKPEKLNHLVLRGEDLGKAIHSYPAVRLDGNELKFSLPARSICTLTSIGIGDLKTPEQLSAPK